MAEKKIQTFPIYTHAEIRNLPAAESAIVVDKSDISKGWHIGFTRNRPGFYYLCKTGPLLQTWAYAGGPGASWENMLVVPHQEDAIYLATQHYRYAFGLLHMYLVYGVDCPPSIYNKNNLLP